VARPEEGDGSNGSLPEVACEYFTPRDLALILNLSTDMVYSMLREGELPAIRLGTGKRQVWRVPQREFRQYIDSIRTGPRFE
jgi:excisionase family DNA binding protein